MPLTLLGGCHQVLTFAKFLSKERDYVVWRSALGHLYGLYSRLFPDGTPTAAETTCINNAAAFVRSLVTPVRSGCW